ncbi:GNAT family N-acetyltransferase [Allomuricauda sp. SCSIO 65647]|uniref:GNAT family N-acetyltransferase n=1 Tax=Allomuricauda sp. SCSIO 65647 TaxID=2908843 RepID=UPI001F262088|nr:GNAT family N-acetyltransferase [Muricauda sp. SCSIO 65647]UJH68363.1 GNAT family N-acetyltransferase [Muricauda sp. SCSIO 65647]
MKFNNTKLRALRPSDIASMAKLANNKKIWNNVRDHFPHPYSERDAEAFLKLQNEEVQQNFAIEYNGQFCGVIGLILQKDVYSKSAELGYWIGEPFWNRGIASKAVELILKYGFEDLKLARIFANTFEFNVASMKVLEKNGFYKEGIAKKAVFKNGSFWDEHRYALLS